MYKLSQELKVLGDKLGKEVREISKLYGHNSGDKLLRHFAKSLDLPNATKLEVKTDTELTVLMYISRVRKILAGGPVFEIPSKGRVGKKEAALALLKMKIRTE